MASLLRDLPLRGILIYVSNTFCFSLISFLVKELSEEFRVAELLLVRFSCTFLGLVVLIQFRGGFYILKTRKTLDLAIRSGAGMIAIALSFVAFYGAILADATALVFSAPLFTLLLFPYPLYLDCTFNTTINLSKSPVFPLKTICPSELSITNMDQNIQEDQIQ